MTYHKKLRSKQRLHSHLEEIAGVGEKRKVQLLRHFGSLKQVREASLDDLQAVPGVPQRVAAAVYEALHDGDP